MSTTEHAADDGVSPPGELSAPHTPPTSQFHVTGASPNRLPLSAGAIDALRAALRSRVSLGDTQLMADAERGALRAALRALSAEARAGGMRPEEVIVLFKGIWDDVVRTAGGISPAERMRMRERLVSACIREYYADGAR